MPRALIRRQTQSPYLVHCVALRSVLSRQTNVDVILAEPFEKTYKSRIYLHYVCGLNSVHLVKFKCCSLDRIGELSAGVVSPLPGRVLMIMIGFSAVAVDSEDWNVSYVTMFLFLLSLPLKSNTGMFPSCLMVFYCKFNHTLQL